MAAVGEYAQQLVAGMVDEAFSGMARRVNSRHGAVRMKYSGPSPRSVWPRPLAGDSARAAQEITAQASAAGLKGSRRTGADACVRYLGNKHDYLHYDQALQAGWPIATGVIEGACRHLIADRLDIGGARWGLDGAEAVLTLRAVISNGDFREYWRFHLEREHQQLYPGTTQGQCALGA
jgi:hypothetical protein